MRRICLLILLALTFPLGAQELTFSAGSTRMQMQEGFQTVQLGGGAELTSGSIVLHADEIELSGDSYRYVQCTGLVSLQDSERALSLTTRSLFYDRQEERIICEGYLELEDTINEVLGSAFNLVYDIQKGELLLQVEVVLYKHTDRGSMVCKADVLRFDRTKEVFDLNGEATIDWDGDRYEAQAISVDLESEEISMDGEIRGVING